MSRFGIRSLVAIVVLLFASGFSFAAEELSSSETAAFMQRLREHRAKFPALTADFAEEKASHLLAKPLITQGTLSFQTPNKFRREVKGANPSITVSNGTRLWIYYPNFNEAELYELGQRGFFNEALTALTAGLSFQEAGDLYSYKVSREGHGWRVAMTPRSGGVKRIVREVVVTVDSELRIAKTEAVLPKGDRVVTTYRNQRATPLPATTFEFTPPEGAKVSKPLGR